MLIAKGAQIPGHQVPMNNGLCTMAPSICGSSVWDILYVTILSPRILRWLLDFCNICAILLIEYPCVVFCAFCKSWKYVQLESLCCSVLLHLEPTVVVSVVVRASACCIYSQHKNFCDDTITWTGVLYGIGHTTHHSWTRAIPIIMTIVILAISLIT